MARRSWSLFPRGNTRSRCGLTGADRRPFSSPRQRTKPSHFTLSPIYVVGGCFLLFGLPSLTGTRTWSLKGFLQATGTKCSKKRRGENRILDPPGKEKPGTSPRVFQFSSPTPRRLLFLGTPRNYTATANPVTTRRRCQPPLSFGYLALRPERPVRFRPRHPDQFHCPQDCGHLT